MCKEYFNSTMWNDLQNLSSVVLEFVEVLSRTKMVTVLLYNSLLRPQLKSSLSSEHQFKVLRKISIIQDLCLTEARKLQIQFSSVTQSCPTLCDPMDCSTPGLPVYHQLPEFTQTHVHRVNDAIQPDHPLLSPSPPAFNLSQHQGLFKWISSLHQVAKVLEF